MKKKDNADDDLSPPKGTVSLPLMIVVVLFGRQGTLPALP